MNDITEVLITSSDSNNSSGNLIYVWDIKTGTILHSYRNGGVCKKKSLCCINNNYMLSGECQKPILHLWQINSQEPIGKNIINTVLPGKVNTLAVSSDGLYCAAGIEEKLYIWQLTTGQLLTIVEKHFQPINKVVFSNDGNHLFSAGDDGIVLIWPFAHLIINSNNQQNNMLTITQSNAGYMDPIHTISDHSMPIQDLYISKSGARLVSVSSDRTMKLYNVYSAQLLISIVFDVSLSAVVLNESETNAFIGTLNGTIYQVSFIDIPRNTNEFHYSNNYNKKQIEKNTFSGHTKSITCLTITIDSKTLVSGSVDENVIIWHIDSKQKLRIIPHKGVISNLHFMIATKNLFTNDFKPTQIIQSFQRNKETEKNQFISVVHKIDKELMFSDSPVNDYSHTNNSSSNRVGTNLINEIHKLKLINENLYQYALNNIVKSKVEIDTNIKKRKFEQ